MFLRCFFGSKRALTILWRCLTGCFCMVFFHAFRWASFGLFGVDYRLQICLFIYGSKILECALCDGR
jgi:hypothetical protein